MNTSIAPSSYFSLLKNLGLRARGFTGERRSQYVRVSPQAVVSGLITIVIICSAASSAHAQLNEHCTVSMMNRTARVRADGSWRIPNIPARNQRVRARATCVENGVTRGGQSSFVDFTPRTTNAFDADISLTTVDPVPAKLTLIAPNTTLPNAGATVQLTATATFPDGQTQAVTAGATGTSYTVSNRAIATVSADGLVTAVSSGAVIVSALNEGVLAMLQLRIGGSSGDSDGDGIPDDVEVANGLNPNDPTDAAQDADNDGLTNKQELIDYNTNPRVADTDGDGVRDGLEIQTGSNPLDPGSRNLAQALTSIGVVPAEFTLTNNSLLSGASRQLTVLGQLRDGSTIDLAKTSTGTTYTSSDDTVCIISGDRILAGGDGTCTITVANNSFTAQSAGTVESFTPVALASILIPGYANNVDVRGTFAYVAAGEAGLQVVNVADPRNPLLVGALDTPGNANDIRVVGTLAYVADGVAGLQIIDVSNPYVPVLRGTFDTAGEAMDVRVIGTRAYVADGEAGLQILDVSVATTPVLLGTIDTPSIARGVDVSGTLAVVADGYTGPLPAGLVTIDVSNPISPQLLTRFEVSSAVDVTLRGGLAYLAGGFLGNFHIVDIGAPASPRLVAELPGFANFEPADLDLFSRFALAADSFAPANRMAITDVFDSAAPNFVASIDLGTVVPAGELYGSTGIALTPQYVYASGVLGNGFENGVTGTSRLFIGQYLKFPEDTAGIAPTVRIITPSTGMTVAEEGKLLIAVEANDDVAVASVDILVNGQIVAPGIDIFEFRIPVGATSVTVGAQATDSGGNVAVAADVVVNVVPDTTPPEVRVMSPTAGSTVLERATLPVTVAATDNVAVVSVELLVDGQVMQTLTSEPYEVTITIPVGVSNLTLSARATDSKGLVTTAQPITLNVVADTIAPTITLLDPQAGASVRERSFVGVVVDAQDNVAVSVVEILVNDQVVQTGGASEIFSVEIPSGIASATFGARARDAAGNVGVAATVTLPVIPDVPPSARILTPTAGELVIERTAVRMNVEASDDVLLTELAVLVNGQVVRTLSSPFGLHPPYRFKVRVPTGVTALTLSVRATDNVGQTYTTSDVVLSVAPDVGTTVTGRVVDQANTPVANATIICLGVSGLSATDGTFALTGVPSLQGAVSCVANGVVTGGGSAGGTSVSRLPVNGGSIAVGDIVLVGATTAPFYTAVPSMSISSFPNAVASGDLNQDGKVDLILGEGGVRILLGNGDGTVQAGQTYSASSGGNVRAVTVADVNRDGVPDIVTANGSATNVGVLLGNGDGAVQAPRTLSTRGTDTADVAVGDLDGDGNPDIVSANDVVRGFFGTGDVTVFLGNGDGTFRALDSVYAGFMPHRVILRDVDVDGILDMLVLERQGLSSGGQVWVLIGQGDGTFAAPQTFAAGNQASGMAMSDFNQDGNLDVLVTNQTTGDLSLLLGNGDGTFQPEQRIFVGGTPQGLIVNDVNFDGATDLAIFDFSVPQVRLLLGMGDGTFPTSEQVPLLGSGTEAFTTGDLNGDNLPDLVVVRRNLFVGSSTIEVLLHR